MIGWKKAVKQGTTRDTWLVALAALPPLDQQARRTMSETWLAVCVAC